MDKQNVQINYILRLLYVVCCLKVSEIKDARIGWTRSLDG
jgi:hypothetical protein